MPFLCHFSQSRILDTSFFLRTCYVALADVFCETSNVRCLPEGRVRLRSQGTSITLDSIDAISAALGDYRTAGLGGESTETTKYRDRALRLGRVLTHSPRSSFRGTNIVGGSPPASPRADHRKTRFRIRMSFGDGLPCEFSRIGPSRMASMHTTALVARERRVEYFVYGSNTQVADGQRPRQTR